MVGAGELDGAGLFEGVLLGTAVTMDGCRLGSVLGMSDGILLSLGAGLADGVLLGTGELDGAGLSDGC